MGYVYYGNCKLSYRECIWMLGLVCIRLMYWVIIWFFFGVKRDRVWLCLVDELINWFEVVVVSFCILKDCCVVVVIFMEFIFVYGVLLIEGLGFLGEVIMGDFLCIKIMS